MATAAATPLRRRVLLAAILAAAATGAPGQMRVASDVNRTRLRVGENLVYTLRVEGAGAIPQPALPALDGFKAAGQYQTVESTQAGKVLLFHYLLSPTRPGRIAVPPMQVVISGKPFRAEGFVAEVETALPVRPEPISGKPLQQGDLLLRGELSSPKAYLSQGVLYTLHLLARPSVRQIGIVKSPDLAGFQRVEDPDAISTPAKQARVKGAIYLDMVVVRYLLFPLRPGPLSVGSFSVTARVEAGDLPGRTVEVPLSGGEASLTVLPLPSPPPDFSGVVGGFTLTLEEPPPGSVQLDQPFSLSFRVEGDGFLPQEPLRWPDTPLFHRYPPAVTEAAGFQEGIYRIRRTYAISLVPKIAGDALLPAVHIVSFDPAAGKYKTLSAGEARLKVLESESARGLAGVRLAPIIPYPRPGAPAEEAFRPKRFLLLLALPFLLAASVSAATLAWRLLLSDPSARRRRGLRRRVRRELARAKRSMDTRRHRPFHDHLARAIEAHLELALNSPASGFTRPHLRSALEEKGLPSETARAVVKTLEELEEARYTPGQPTLRELQERYNAAWKIAGGSA